MTQMDQLPHEDQKMFSEQLSAQIKAWEEEFGRVLPASHKGSLKVCSFSATGKSIIMWSHYADQHRGFCIEYDTESLPPENLFIRMLFPVVYSERMFDGTKYYLAAIRNRTTFNTLFPSLAALSQISRMALRGRMARSDSGRFVEEGLDLAGPNPEAGSSGLTNAPTRAGTNNRDLPEEGD
jgi:hypothetical protein